MPAIILQNNNLICTFTTFAYKFSVFYSRLDRICDLRGKKIRLALGTKPHVFSYNSSESNLHSLKCHLELSVPSSLFGFSVFLEELSLAGSVKSGCPHDFVQFGRDILFVTTHMSSKYCGDIEIPVTTEVAGVTTLELPASPIASRIYREDSDREMDIWIHVTKGDQGDKIINMVVTPVMKSCKGRDRDYKQCGYLDSCVRKELFCDGRVNCAAQLPQGNVKTLKNSDMGRILWLKGDSELFCWGTRLSNRRRIGDRPITHQTLITSNVVCSPQLGKS